MTDSENMTETPVAESAPEFPAETTAPKAKSKVKADASVRAIQPYAVIETGGKQYRVGVGDRIAVERLAVDAGSVFNFERVLLLGGDGSTRIGTPIVDGANVTAFVDEHNRGEKIIIFKFKAKKRYRRRTGHRQEFTRLTITGISG